MTVSFREPIVALGVGLLLLVSPLMSNDGDGEANAKAATPSKAQPVSAETTTPELLANPILLSPSTEEDCLDFAHVSSADDGRVRAVREFLWQHQCPIEPLAATFVLASDLNGLDYRLLPTLAVLESGCGRAARNHNLFGWANGRKPFTSFEHAIHFVAQRLRLAPHYAGKTMLEKLRVYNRRAAYRAKVLRVMETIRADNTEAIAGSAH
ncbi:MAG: hypothetical protein KIT83_10325 [Bryobacterales bacterium]|nr:hypothetical protein [Bryobacterales bacterium]